MKLQLPCAKRITSSWSGPSHDGACAPHVCHFIVHTRRAGPLVTRPLNCGVSRARNARHAMNITAPTKIAIDHDDYHAAHVGKLADGRQFFATTPFVPPIKTPGREFIAIYIFDSSGRLVEARIDDLGPRGSLDPKRAKALFDRRIDELGPLKYGRIEVEPFHLDRYGEAFGLIARPPEASAENDSWWVEVQPGNYMAFHEPWDSGEYDT
jgi:hypothetical protein